MGKTKVAHCGSLNKILSQTEFQTFFLAIVLCSKRKVFIHKNFFFKGSEIFWKWKPCWFFGIGLIKIYLIASLVPAFGNRQKVLYHSTLLYVENVYRAMFILVVERIPVTATTRDKEREKNFFNLKFLLEEGQRNRMPRF